MKLSLFTIPLCSIVLAGLIGKATADPASVTNSRQNPLVIEVGHRGEVNQIAFSADSKLFASASVDSTVMLYDVADGSWMKTLRGHRGAVNCLTFVPGTSLMASGDSANAVLLWNVTTGTSVRRFFEAGTSEVERARGVLRLAVSPDGKVLAAASRGGVVRLWNVATGELLKRIETSIDTIDVLGFSTDARTLFTADARLPLRSWNAQTGAEQLLFDDKSSPGATLAIAPDGRQIAFRNARGSVVLWDVQTARAATVIQLPRAVNAVTFAPDGKSLIGKLALNLLVTWNEKGEITRAIETGQEMITVAAASLAASPDGKLVVMANSKGVIKLWDMPTGKLRVRLPMFRMSASQVISGNLKGANFASVIAAYDDGSVFVWDASQGKLVKTMRNQGRSIAAAALTPDGATLALAVGWESYTLTMETEGVPYQEIQFWDTRTWTLQRTIKLGGHNDGVGALVFSPDSKLLAAGPGSMNNDSVRFWSVENGEEKLRLGQRNTTRTSAIAFSPDGTLFASNNNIGVGLQVWELEGEKPLLQRRDSNASNTSAMVFLSKDHIAAVGDYGLRLFDIGANKWLPGLEKEGESARSLVLARRRKNLATVTKDGEVRLWSTGAWQLQGSLKEKGADAPGLGARHLAFSPDEKQLITDSASGSLKVWNSDDGQLIATMQVLPNVVGGSESPEWITWTPGGDYVGSPNAAQFVRLQNVPNTTVTGIEEKHRRPDQVKKALLSEP
jgi:WD40 repeat protein